MSSNNNLSPAVNNKTSSPSIISNYSQNPAFSTSEISQKRSNSSGSFGPGSQTRGAPQARSNQPAKNKHKAQRRARLIDDDAADETAAMKSVNSRKGQTSITHLMNFALPPRPPPVPQYSPHQRFQRRNPTWGLGSGYHAVDKARYVHANYRFIVRPDGDYHVHATDTDVHLGWDKVLQILASSDTQSSNCPICLSVPVAPRMAKCGHIFCLPCLIRYMHSGEEDHHQDKRVRWKKCPICEDSVYVSETRPVRWFVGQEASMLQEGGDVLLKLLMRPPGNTLALPRDAAEGYGPSGDVPWFNIAEMMDYARIMRGGEEYMEAQYDKEIEELNTQEVEDELMFGDENTWTRKAVASIEQAKSRIVGIGNPPSEKRQPAEEVELVPNSWYQETTASSTLSNGMRRMSLSADTRGHTTSRHNLRSRSHAFFFYHALPNFFLSPLDIRILKTAFGDFSSFPSTILPRVEHISTGHVVDDDLRKRAKYMGHLPYGCEVSFLECDWTDIISPTILAQFQDDIDRRRKRNTEKEAREERDRVRAEKLEEEQRYSATRRRRPSMAGNSFPETDFQPLANPDPFSHDDTFATTPPWGNHRTHSSFATLGSPGTSPDAARTVWGTAAIAPMSPVIAALPAQDVIDDGWLQGWERDLLSESDAVAMVEASLNGESSARSSNGGQKKKKGKKITLMSTNQRRAA